MKNRTNNSSSSDCQSGSRQAENLSLIINMTAEEIGGCVRGGGGGGEERGWGQPVLSHCYNILNCMVTRQ